MTKKDYIALADALGWAYAEQVSDDGRYGVMSAASVIGNSLWDDNPRFDKPTFMAHVHKATDAALVAQGKAQ